MTASSLSSENGGWLSVFLGVAIVILFRSDYSQYLICVVGRNLRVPATNRTNGLILVTQICKWVLALSLNATNYTLAFQNTKVKMQAIAITFGCELVPFNLINMFLLVCLSRLFQR
jgi:hypothetical protein